MAVPTAIDIDQLNQKLLPSDGDGGDRFGRSAVLQEDTLVVGAPLAGGGGAAYVFVRGGGAWVEQAKLTASDRSAGDEFGRSVDVDGDTAVVGAWRDGGGGSAYIFVRSGGSWMQQAKIRGADIDGDADFGISVALQGDRAVVGARRNGSFRGNVYVFERTGTIWSQTARLSPTNTPVGANFGYSVDLDGDTIVVGQRREDETGGFSGSGSVYFFHFNGVMWTLQDKFTVNTGSPSDFFGVATALSADTALVGASLDDDGGNNAGAVYVYQRTGGSWSLLQKLIAPDALPDANFGREISVESGSAIVGAPRDDGVANLSGAAYLLAENSSGWAVVKKLVAFDAEADDRLGGGVAMDGDTVAVGANSADDLGPESGVVYLSGNQPPVANAGPDQVVECTSPEGTEVTLNGLLSNDPDGDALEFRWAGPFSEGGGVVSGGMPTVTLAKGTHTITLTVTDPDGASDSDQVVVTVEDSTPPEIASLTVDPAVLWPPNHKMVTVSVSVDVSDQCDASPSCRISSVESNEPVDGEGDGNTAPDWTITGDLTADLRAERSGTGSGRVYTVTVECTDAAGLTSTSSVDVLVPKSQSR